MPKRAPKRQAKRKLVRDFILNNPTATNYDVVKAVMVSESLASKVRTELRNEGLIRPLGMDRTSRPADVATDDTISEPVANSPETVEITATRRLMELASEEEARLKATGSNFDFAAQEAMLIRFAKKEDESAATRMIAVDKLNKLRADQKGRDALGPGEPLSEEDMLTRLTFLIKAVGFKLAVRAFERAFKKGGAANGAAQDNNPDGAGVPTPPPSPAGPDDQDAEVPQEGRGDDLGHGLGDGEALEHPSADRPETGIETDSSAP